MSDSAYNFVPKAHNPCPIDLVVEKDWKKWIARQTEYTQKWVETTDYKGHPESHLIVPSPDGRIALVVLVINSETPDVWTLSSLTDLPPGAYQLEEEESSTERASALALGWALGQYQFNSFKTIPKKKAQLVFPRHADMNYVHSVADAIFMGRTLINTPTNKMQSLHLENKAREIAATNKAHINVTVGDALLDNNFPAIHAVGRASDIEPRLIDLTWGEGPKVTLVGKGVCFDSGGLNIKPAASMLKMRKDMGGAAAVLSLGQIIMNLNLNINLRILIPAVENSISSNSYRQGDILETRKGKTVSVGHTDAEGRLVLCDALTYANEDNPDLIIDMATLTGAARVALGPDIPPFFTNDDDIASELQEISFKEHDPLWQMPLWKNYRKLIDSYESDIKNVSQSSHAGAIIAALFLYDFIMPKTKWIHIDTYGWNETSKPGRPEGGEILAVRALLKFLINRYQK